MMIKILIPFLNFIKNLGKISPGRCCECGRKVSIENLIVDTEISPPSHKLASVIEGGLLKDTFCKSCHDYLIESERVLFKNW